MKGQQADLKQPHRLGNPEPSKNAAVPDRQGLQQSLTVLVRLLARQAARDQTRAQEGS